MVNIQQVPKDYLNVLFHSTLMLLYFCCHIQAICPQIRRFITDSAGICPIYPKTMTVGNAEKLGNLFDSL
jgi:hypothetical protein